jgi:hypothetical protein
MTNEERTGKDLKGNGHTAVGGTIIVVSAGVTKP